MDLRSHYPYSLLRHGIVNSYPSLKQDIKADVVVMGAGISGSLVAEELVRCGYDVVVVDKRHAGMGSTAASTSLLQYELDIPLYRLIQLVGEKNAVSSYLLCREAIYILKDTCEQFNDKSLFSLRPSFQFASSRPDLAGLDKEYRARKNIGIELDLLVAQDSLNYFSIESPGGLFSEDGAEADAYKITHSLLSAGISRGLRVFDHTEVKNISYGKNEITLLTANKNKITAKNLVIACGYESQQYIPKKIQSLHSTYVIASEPQEKKEPWYRNALIWETAKPYSYLRTTDDNRMMIGGRDISSANPAKRDRKLKAKKESLEKNFRKIFPHLNFTTDFSWAGSFASTKDALPYIGRIPGKPNTFYALGYGGNGTTFSVIAAGLIRDLLTGKQNYASEIFSFNR